MRNGFCTDSHFTRGVTGNNNVLTSFTKKKAKKHLPKYKIFIRVDSFYPESSNIRVSKKNQELIFEIKVS